MISSSEIFELLCLDEELIGQFLQGKATSEDVKRSCQSLQIDNNRKYGQVDVAEKAIPAKWTARIVDNIGRFVIIRDFAMKGTPETVGLAWFAAKQVLNAVQNNYKLYRFFGTTLSSIIEMVILIRTYDKLYDSHKNSDRHASDTVGELFGQIRKVYAAILDFSFSVKST